jgi:hypothetical protein
MTKEEYNQKKQEIIDRLGQPEWDNFEAVNDSAKELAKLKGLYRSSLASDRRQKDNEVRLSQPEVEAVESEARPLRAVPIDLTESDLIGFDDVEKDVILSYFNNTNLLPRDLNKLHPKLSTQKIAALLRSGPFAVLASKVWHHIAPVKVQWALLKLIEAKNPKIVERMAENFGQLKPTETNMNINKPLDVSDPELLKKLKELGDAQ